MFLLFIDNNFKIITEFEKFLKALNSSIFKERHNSLLIIFRKCLPSQYMENAYINIFGDNFISF